LSLVMALAVSAYHISKGPGQPGATSTTKAPAAEPAYPAPATETPPGYPAPATATTRPRQTRPKTPEGTYTAPARTAPATAYVTATAPLPECGPETTVPCFTSTPKGSADADE
jgi:hypothetical protein